jgi:hypothetical protein
MPLKKLLFRPGVSRENTRYLSENVGPAGVNGAYSAGWYDCDKVRFRSGSPEKIGGWQRISANFFLGVCRSLWNWITLDGANLLGVGTNVKFYIGKGGAYIDITPIRDTVTLTNPFTATLGSAVITVADTAHGCTTGDFVTFSGATGLGGNITAGVLNREYQVTVVNANSYTITTSATANATDVSGSPGGASVTAAYQINGGPSFAIPSTGWGAGPWGFGPWGDGTLSISGIRLWSQFNFGQDLVFGPRGGSIYYWNAADGVTTRGKLLRDLGGTATITIASPAVVTSTVLYPAGAAVIFSTTGALPTGITAGTTYFAANNAGLTFQLVDTAGNIVNTSGTQSGTQTITPADIPVIQNYLLVSDVSRFVLAFGCNDVGGTTQNPMLIRWSDQESATDWTPAPTNQAGSLQLSRGSEIVTAIQSRQEILVFTDNAVYALQYLGPPIVWGATLLGDNTSIVSQNAAAIASGVTYWMGVDKFYKYDGRVQTLRCDLRQYIFSDINKDQYAQIFSGTNEGFNEVWWFYCSQYEEDGQTLNSTVNRYVIYNYLEDIWYYGTMGRTAWLDSGLLDYPIAATYANNLVNHEFGVDDKITEVSVPIEATITSAEFDLDDGHNFMFLWRVLPDITFRGSEVESPTARMYMQPLKNSGSGYTTPPSVGGENNRPITRTAVLPIEEFTGQIFTRVRARQMSVKVESTGLGVTWQLGAPRLDLRPDGRR